MSNNDFKTLEEETKNLQNVVGAARKGPEGKPCVLVTEKKPESELPADQLVANNTSLDADEHHVIEVGHLVAEPKPNHGRGSGSDHPHPDVDAEGDDETVVIESRQRYDPVPAGGEEQPAGKKWVGTGGPLCVVTDPSKGRWEDDVSEGDVVRLSNWHVYVGGFFQPRRGVNQPYGGRQVGELIGGVPIEDGVRVDVAARSVSEEDGWGAAGLDEHYGRGVRENVDTLVDETVTKSGRTTDVTEGVVLAIGANVRVTYSNGTYRIEDCVITEKMGAGGDSGSAVYVKESGDLVSLHFAGSDTVSVSVRMANVMEDLGVDPITDWDPQTPPHEHPPDEPDPEPPEEPEPPSWWFFPFPFPFEWWPPDFDFFSRRLTGDHHISEYQFEELVEAYFVEEFGEANVRRQYYFREMRRFADLMVETPVGNYAIEIENDFEACFKGVGQTIVYAGPSEDWYPMVILPEGEADHPEIEYMRNHVPVLEFPVPEDADSN